MRYRLEPRLPIRWATHSMHILMVVSVLLGGSLFGLAFALWPQGPVDLILGGVILAGVLALAAWVVIHLLRPVRRS